MLVLLWNRKPLRFCLPLLLALVLLLGLKGFSPMEQRQMRSLIPMSFTGKRQRL